MKSLLNAAHYCNEEAARVYGEAWLWPEGPVCPRCGTAGEATLMKGENDPARSLELSRLPNRSLCGCGRYFPRPQGGEIMQ